MDDTLETDASAVQQRIDSLLRQGKNVYQPLYNYPYHQIIDPLRGCADRCAAVWTSMGEAARGKRLWDAGCSLGHNTLYFVDRGMIGHGTDIDPRNIAICQEIARYTPGAATFAEQELCRETVEDIPPDRFEYAFFFSILHHLIEIHGLSYVQAMMRALLQRIPVLYVELALASETSPPGYGWEAHLPDDELEIFATCDRPDIQLVGRFPTHVCDLDRPLYRVARKETPLD